MSPRSSVRRSCKSAYGPSALPPVPDPPMLVGVLVESVSIPDSIQNMERPPAGRTLRRLLLIAGVMLAPR
jgi:hypothetical protein